MNEEREICRWYEDKTCKEPYHECNPRIIKSNLERDEREYQTKYYRRKDE